jgi:hypothetical protein
MLRVKVVPSLLLVILLRLASQIEVFGEAPPKSQNELQIPIFYNIICILKEMEQKMIEMEGDNMIEREWRERLQVGSY